MSSCICNYKNADKHSLQSSTSARMKLLLVICIGLAQFCCYSYTFPIAPPRERRQALNDYISTVFVMRSEFIAADCNTTYNGAPVSPHFCTTDILKFFLAEDENACSLDFTIKLREDGEKAVGADLALYKLPEIDANENNTYTVYIDHKQEDNFFPPITKRSITSTSYGWQVFNIDTAAIKWPSRVSKFSARIQVQNSNGTFLPCSSVSTLFILSAEEDYTGSGIEPLLVNTESRPLNAESYTPIITAFTIMSAIECYIYPELCPPQPPTSTTPVSLRRKRSRNSCSHLHDYVLDIFSLREYFRTMSCNTTFNGQSVSQHYCNEQVRPKFFGATEQDTRDSPDITCNVHFDIVIEDSERALGADLALYIQSPTTEWMYVYIIHQESERFYSIVANGDIPAGSSGWQVFHFDDNTLWQSGNNRLELMIYVMNQNHWYIKCPDMSSLFVMPYAQTSGSGDITNGDKDCQDCLRNFDPVITIFTIAGRPITLPLPRTTYKRSAASKALQNQNELEPRGNVCKPQDHHVNLAETFPESDIIFPKVANLKRCSVNCAQSQSQDTKTKCVPTKFDDLDVLVRNRDSEQGYAIQTLPDTIAQECHCL